MFHALLGHGLTHPSVGVCSDPMGLVSLEIRRGAVDTTGE